MFTVVISPKLGVIMFQSMFLAGPIALWVLSPLILVAQRSGLYMKQSSSCIQYRKPMQQRIGYLLLAASLPWSATYLQPFSWHWPEYIVAIGLALGLVYLSGPSEVIIDVNKRTYTFRSGWPLTPKIKHGSLEDILALKISKNTESGLYMLILRWKAKQGGLVIGQFWSKSRVEAAAVQVLKSLDIQVPIDYLGAT